MSSIQSRDLPACWQIEINIEVAFYYQFIVDECDDKAMWEESYRMTDCNRFAGSRWLENFCLSIRYRQGTYWRGNQYWWDIETRLELLWANADRIETENGTKEADIVSARIAKLLGEKMFQISLAEWLEIHRRLFEGVFTHAGQIRQNILRKRNGCWKVILSPTQRGTAFKTLLIVIL